MIVQRIGEQKQSSQDLHGHNNSCTSGGVAEETNYEATIINAAMIQT